MDYPILTRIADLVLIHKKIKTFKQVDKENTWILTENEGDGNTNCSLGTWNSLKGLKKETERIEEERKIETIQSTALF